MVGINRADNLQGVFFGQRSAETGLESVETYPVLLLSTCYYRLIQIKQGICQRLFSERYLFKSFNNKQLISLFILSID